MRVLTNEDVQKVLTPEECLSALEVAYIEHAQGQAANRPRNHTYFPVEDDRHPGFRFRFKTQEGGNVSSQFWAVRITSDMAGIETLPNGVQRRRLLPLATGGTYVGLVFLFSMRDLELKAIIHDSIMQKMRVGATSALGIRELAPSRAKVAGLFGSGWQAGAHLDFMLLVRPSLEEIRVSSPTRENRERFAEEWSSKTGKRVVAVSSPRQAVDGSDIVMAATAAMDPVFDGGWLRPGMHVTSITSPDAHSPRRELDDTTFDRADRIVVFSRDQVHHDNQFDILGPVERGLKEWEDIAELGQVLAGQVPGRTSSDELTVFANNTGMGLQFAAVGARVLALAEEAGLGTELPAEWFVEDTSP